jgi:hypothetical protein
MEGNVACFKASLLLTDASGDAKEKCMNLNHDNQSQAWIPSSVL